MPTALTTAPRHRAALLLCLLALPGCTGAYTVDLTRQLRSAHLPPLEAPGRGVRIDEASGALYVSRPPDIVIEHRLVLRGTAGAGYDSLLWWVLKMPCLAGIGPDGERCLVLIDSGLGELARVTADVAARQQLPARTRPPAIAWVPRLDLADGVSLREFPASIYPMRWEARLLGLPLWRHSGYVLGLPALRGFAYVEFDNPRRRVTFSAFNAFAPGKAAGWEIGSAHV